MPAAFSKEAYSLRKKISQDQQQLCFQEPGQICLPAGSLALPNWGPGTKKHRKTHRPSHSLPKALTAPLDCAGLCPFLRLPQPLDLSIRALVTRWGIVSRCASLLACSWPCPWCPALKSLRPRSLQALAPVGHISDHIILSLQDPTCPTGIHLHKLVCPPSWPRVRGHGAHGSAPRRPWGSPAGPATLFILHRGATRGLTLAQSLPSRRTRFLPPPAPENE